MKKSRRPYKVSAKHQLLCKVVTQVSTGTEFETSIKKNAMKILYLSVLFIFLLISLSAQIPANSGGPVADMPPSFIEENFKKEYPGITPTWHVDETLFIADFTDPNIFKGVSIVYDRKGNVVRRENEMENSTYPQAINEYFVKNYPGEKFKTWKCQDDKGMQGYCIKRPSGAVRFNKEGKYIEPEKKNDQTAAAEVNNN